MKPLDIVLLTVAAVVAATGFFTRIRIKTRLKKPNISLKKLKRIKTLSSVMSLAGSWLFVVRFLAAVFGSRSRGEFSVELGAEKWSFFGHSLSSTVIVTWAIIIVLFLLSLIVRIFIIPKFSDVPKGLQKPLEIIVEYIDKYTESNAAGIGKNLGAYIFTVAVFMISCAAAGLLGVRSPTADLTMTAAMALITFVLINYYGIKHKGFSGRLKSLASPTPLVFPIRVISDFAIPVSMACRLFGNMLGGLIVMELLYYALGSAAIGIPSVVGLYFNVFHPLIQAFIFVTLTLTFISEATETTETA